MCVELLGQGLLEDLNGGLLSGHHGQQSLSAHPEGGLHRAGLP